MKRVQKLQRNREKGQRNREKGNSQDTAKPSLDGGNARDKEIRLPIG